jgi:hypothetical protein
MMPYRWIGVRHIGGVVITIAILGASRQATAQPSDQEEMRKPHMVVLMTSSDDDSARREANRAADRLGYSVAPDTLQKPARRRIYVGSVVTLQRAGAKGVEVISFLGDLPDAQKALGEARRYYPGARLVPVALPKNATDAAEVPYARLGILVLGSYKSYEEALRAAKKFSARSAYPYGSRGMVYEKARGLIWPDDSSDEAWAGSYAPRRYDNECDGGDSKPCITVERSEGYEGFTPGLYIVVGGVLGREERGERLAAARRIVPEAYVKQTTIYLGCTH